MSFFKEHLQILKIAGPWLLISFLSYSFLDESLSARLQESLNSPSGIGPELWIFGGLSMCLGIVLPCFNLANILGSIIKIRGASQNYSEILARSFPQLIIENMRSWGSAMTWGLLLILPGFIRFFQLYFVPFIVMMDKDYAEGKIDALKSSHRKTNQVWLSLSVVVFIFDFLLPLITHGAFDEYRSLSKTPLPAVMLILSDLIFFILSVQICLRLFEKLKTSSKAIHAP